MLEESLRESKPGRQARAVNRLSPAAAVTGRQRFCAIPEGYSIQEVTQASGTWVALHTYSIYRIVHRPPCKAIFRRGIFCPLQPSTNIVARDNKRKTRTYFEVTSHCIFLLRRQSDRKERDTAVRACIEVQTGWCFRVGAHDHEQALYCWRDSRNLSLAHNDQASCWSLHTIAQMLFWSTMWPFHNIVAAPPPPFCVVPLASR